MAPAWDVIVIQTSFLPRYFALLACLQHQLSLVQSQLTHKAKCIPIAEIPGVYQTLPLLHASG